MPGATLILVHLLFRHGERTPDGDYMYPKDPFKDYKFEPYGQGQLTNEGKVTMYDLGTNLKKRYDDFLDEGYRPYLVDSWSSGYDRAKASLLVLLAGLYPPTENLKWNKYLNWQPIPMHHIEREDDELFLSVVTSKKYKQLYLENFKSSAEGKRILNKYAGTLSYIRQMTGFACQTTREIYAVRDCLKTEVEFGLRLSQWTKTVYPDKLDEISLLENYMETETDVLKKLTSGKLLSKMLRDTKAKISGQSRFQIHLYSGHDVNISNFLQILNLMYSHFPMYGACVAIEVHDANENYELKVLYKESNEKDFKHLIFPSGKSMISIDEFETIVMRIMNADTDFANNIDYSVSQNITI